MKTVAVIPARYASTRFHGKVLVELCGKPIIYHVYKNAKETPEIDDVIVATDDKIVLYACEALGIKAVMTGANHTSGTSRIIEVAKNIDADVIINVQGDEPLINKNVLSPLIKCFDDETVDIATVKTLIKEKELIDDENAVKVVCDINGYAMYFSRAGIPYRRSDVKAQPKYHKHIGVYAYRKEALLSTEKMKECEYEKTEMLEQLKWLYAGMKIKVIETDIFLHGIDTKEDLRYVEKIIK